MRLGFAISAAAHLAALLVALGLFGSGPIEATPTDGITVDLVPADEAPPVVPAPVPAKAEPPKPILPKFDMPRPGASTPAPAPPPELGRQAPSPAAAAPSPPPPATEPSPEPSRVPEADVLEQMASLKSTGDFDAVADVKAKLSAEEIAALKAQVQKCWEQPAGLAGAANLLAVVRVSFKPNGTLTADPTLIAARASPLGPALVRAALDAVRRCQPYVGLPAAKYSEWRVLDLNFTATGLSGS